MKANQVAKEKQAGSTAATAPQSKGDEILQAAVEQLKAGADVPGFTLIPVKKVKGNQLVEDTGEVIERAGVKFAVCTVAPVK